MEQVPAFVAFQKNMASTTSLVRCADIYGIHALANLRGEAPNVELINKIIATDGLSTLTWSWALFMTNEERSKFGEHGHLRAVCEHIVFASYVAVESYLIGKFREYFTHKYSSMNKDQQDSILKKISLRSLDEIKRQYADILHVNIAHFEPTVGIFEEAPWFHPPSCWKGLKILEECRNSLAHCGEMKNARLVVLVDAWSVREFCREWVEYFESHFDDLIFHNRASEYSALCVPKNGSNKRSEE